jgi:hypothetical protein
MVESRGHCRPPTATWLFSSIAVGSLLAGVTPKAVAELKYWYEADRGWVLFDPRTQSRRSSSIHIDSTREGPDDIFEVQEFGQVDRSGALQAE